MLNYGCTRLEIGVQSVYEDVARDTNRGHTVRAVSESFHMGKGKLVSYVLFKMVVFRCRFQGCCSYDARFAKCTIGTGLGTIC